MLPVKVSLTLQVAVYVCLSRVKELLSLCVLQPFSPLLFKRGPPPGPHRLMRKLEGTLTADDAMEEWRQGVEVEDDTKQSCELFISLRNATKRA